MGGYCKGCMVHTEKRLKKHETAKIQTHTLAIVEICTIENSRCNKVVWLVVSWQKIPS